MATATAAPAPGVDPTFDPGRGPTNFIPGNGRAILLQPDGKIVVGGHFNAVNLTYVPPIIRFNPDGSLDSSFDASVLAPPAFSSTGSTDMYPLAVLPSGQLLISGMVINADGSRRYFVRLNADGALDPTFNPRIERSGQIWTIGQAKALNDGKILISGGFDSVNGLPRAGLARLNADGSTDTTFDPAISGSFALQSSGKLIVLSGNLLYRLNSDGTQDPSFHVGIPSLDGAFGSLGSFVVQPDDRVLFSFRYDGIGTSVFDRLNADGTTDNGFQPFHSYEGWPVLVQNDGKILIYTLSGSEPRRLNPDGTPDWSFATDKLGYVAAQQSDGKIVTAGDLSDYPVGIRRLFLDGTVDPTFAPDVGLTVITPTGISRTILLPNGKVVVSGSFNYFDRIPHQGGALLKRDGAPDPAADFSELLSHVRAVQADGKLLAAVPSHLTFEDSVVRINQDGTLDHTFSYTSPNRLDVIDSVVVQRDSKILIASSSELVRFNPDGTRDATFQANQPAPIVLVQPDGKIVVRNRLRGLARLNPDGSPDPGFTAAGLNAFSQPYAVALQPDGKFLISRSSLSTFGNVFVRLNPDGTADESFHPDVNTVKLIAVDQTGIYAAGSVEPAGVKPTVNGICRFNFDGSRDPDFKVESDGTVTELIVQPDGQLLVTGGFSRLNGVERHGIARLIGVAPRKLANISTRVRVGTGDSAAIAGFIVTGSATKNVIIRALGPSLQTQNAIVNALANPALEVHDSSGAIIARNDDWRLTQESEISATGMPPGNDAESALVLKIQPGSYTAVIRGADGGTGVALAEIYDLNPSANSAVANISTRGVVENADAVLIGGFILRGSETATVVVRALGPSLGKAGVREALGDPILTLYDQSGSAIASNDNWKQTQQQELETVGMGLSDEREAAVIASLPPGPYTAVVRAADGAKGVGLVEVYRLE